MNKSLGFSGAPIALFMALMFCMSAMPYAYATEGAISASAQTAVQHAGQSSEAVMQQFAGDDEVSAERRIETKRKHQILFLMGISLLILLSLTGSFGVAMVAFDKDVFIPHMIFAGLSLTLAAVHAATAIAWFWPY